MKKKVGAQYDHNVFHICSRVSDGQSFVIFYTMSVEVVLSVNSHEYAIMMEKHVESEMNTDEK